MDIDIGIRSNSQAQSLYQELIILLPCLTARCTVICYLGGRDKCLSIFIQLYGYLVAISPIGRPDYDPHIAGGLVAVDISGGNWNLQGLAVVSTIYRYVGLSRNHRYQATKIGSLIEIIEIDRLVFAFLQIHVHKAAG